MLNHTYPEDNPVYLDKEYGPPKEYFKLIVSILKKEFERPFSLLDVGCASGHFLNFALSELKVSHFSGIDISEKSLGLASNNLPKGSFFMDSLLNPQIEFEEPFEVCTCLGSLSGIDEIERCLETLLSYIGDRGHLFLYDIVNDEPVDVLMRSRRVDAEQPGEWLPSFNLRSKVTLEKIIKSLDEKASIEFIDFKMPFSLEKKDCMRAWTFKTEENPHQLVVGTGQLLNFKVVHIIKNHLK